MKPGPSPNMMAQPTAQKASEAMPKTTKFLPRMFTAFFARQNPASTQPNPAFMKNTRKAAVKVQSVSMATSTVQGSSMFRTAFSPWVRGSRAHRTGTTTRDNTAHSGC